MLRLQSVSLAVTPSDSPVQANSNTTQSVTIITNKQTSLPRQVITKHPNALSSNPNFMELRNQSKVVIPELQTFMFGPNYSYREAGLKNIEDYPEIFRHYHLHSDERPQIREHSAVAIFQNRKLYKETYEEYMRNPNLLSLISSSYASYNSGFSVKNGVHLFLYLKTLINLGTQDHQSYRQRAIAMQDIGCFGLTEMLHGSNVKGILTEAHYDHVNQEFVINTPSHAGMKFWIGAAANIANMSVVWAQLYIGDKCYGVHSYLVPVRDLETHNTLPGVTIGDCGPKNGLNQIDNGFMIFDHVRIPKKNQLDRISGVDANGKFRSIVKGEEKRFGLHLAALSGGRFLISMNAGILAFEALSIAIRYCCLRRQFSTPSQNKAGKGDLKEASKETLLIEYPLTRRRMMPLLAQAFVNLTCIMQIIYRWDSNHDAIMDPTNKIIQELHAISSAMKPKSSWFTTHCIKECRQMMGGHGYSGYSKLGQLYHENDINNTWEGDNTVLIQQTTKFVLDQAQSAMKGKPINSMSLEFLSSPPSEAPVLNEETLQCPRTARLFLQYKIWTKIQETASKLMALKTSNKQLSNLDIWNSSQVYLGRTVALTTGDLFYIDTYSAKLATVKNPANQEALSICLILWMLKVYREDEFIDSTLHPTIQRLISLYSDRLATHALALLEVVVPSDSSIGSPFADVNGKGIDKYLQLIERHPKSQGPSEWLKETLLRRSEPQ